MAFRARKVSGAFEKRAPDPGWPQSNTGPPVYNLEKELKLILPFL